MFALLAYKEKQGGSYNCFIVNREDVNSSMILYFSKMGRDLSVNGTLQRLTVLLTKHGCLVRFWRSTLLSSCPSFSTNIHLIWSSYSNIRAASVMTPVPLLHPVPSCPPAMWRLTINNNIKNYSYNHKISIINIFPGAWTCACPCPHLTVFWGKGSRNYF